MMMTENSDKVILVSAKKLKQVIYIQYPITFPNGITLHSSALDLVSALLDLGNKVNVIHPAFIERLGLVI